MEMSLKKQLEDEWFSIEHLTAKWTSLQQSPLYRRTPILVDCCDALELADCKLDLKMESLQLGGSYKMRGVVCQMDVLRHELSAGGYQGVVTMSAGNYGIALSTYCAMVETCSSSRISSLLDRRQEEGWKLCHPFDDLNLICGYGSIMFEIVEKVGEPDVILVPAGPVAGGGLLCGVALAARLMELPTKVFGVEMIPVDEDPACKSNSILRRCASMRQMDLKGLTEKYYGETTFRICFDCVDGILSVSEKQILQACSKLFAMGIIVEPFGASALAALCAGRLPEMKSQKVVSVLSCRNVDLKELVQLNSM
ncbi:unnamed protein product [Soboliphyme baturini]|uniref:L-serine deaminase n=1 Tax=Soboliphyme baturini TaxID=241478 RepID=A0A183IZN7_9BILA|nr:unnamed protein product [Soboliphyme baturini]